MAVKREDPFRPGESRESGRASEQQLRQALQASRMVAWEWDPGRDVVTTTENVPEIFGIPAVHMAEQGFAMVHPDDLERHRAEVDRALSTGAGYQSEFRIVRPDNGAVIWMEERGTPVLDETGKVQKIVGVVMDITSRKQAEEGLRRSEGLYRSIVATANEGIWLIGPDTQTIYANDRMAEMLGYAPEELQQLAVVDCAFPGEETRHREHIEQNLKGDVEQFDTRFRRKDGSELLVLGCTSPVRDGEGRVVGALGMFTDITERVRAEQERLELLAGAQLARAQAEEAQERLSLLADASALLASSLDYETTLRSLAEAVVPKIADWCAVHLVDEDGSVRQVTVAHLDPEKAELARELEMRYLYDPDAPAGVPQVLRTGRPELISEVSDDLLESLSPDADLLRMLRALDLTSWMVVPLIAREHLLGAITLVATTESGRHYTPEDVALAEVLARRAALAVDNARLYRDAQQLAAEQSAILSQMADGVVIVDPAGRVTFRNEAARRLTGGTPSESLESAFDRYHITAVDGQPYSPEDLPLARALAQRETVASAQWRVRRQDGTEVILQGSATPVVGQNGELLGAVSTFRDITALAALEQEKEAFLSAVAHDLKTPLTTLKGFAQILLRRLAREDGPSPEQLREGLARIEQNAGRMSSLIDELLDLSRLQMGEGLELNRRPMDLVSLVSREVSDARQATASERVILQCRVEMLTGTWDAERLERVVANLLSNATKYSPGDTPITVTVTREEKGNTPWAVLSVQDRGIGIPPEDLPHIFERFHRARNVGRESLGTGIGLSGAKQIVEQHGGTIEVASQEGHGSTFTVRLPLTPIHEGIDQHDRPE